MNTVTVQIGAGVTATADELKEMINNWRSNRAHMTKAAFEDGLKRLLDALKKAEAK